MNVAEFYTELRSCVPEFFSSSSNVIVEEYQFIELTEEQKKDLTIILSNFLDQEKLAEQIEENPGEAYGALNEALKVAGKLLDEQPALFSLATEFKDQAYKTRKKTQRWEPLLQNIVPICLIVFGGAFAFYLISLIVDYSRAGVDYSTQTLTAEKCTALKTERTFRGDFSLTSLPGCQLDGLELGYSSWTQSKGGPGTSFRKVAAAYANFSQVTMPGVSFSGANLESANLRLANFSGGDFSLTNLRSANLDGTNFSGAKMPGSYLGLSSMEGTLFQNAELTGANFEGSEIRNADFSKASLRGANFSYRSSTKYDYNARLGNVSFRKADL